MDGARLWEALPYYSKTENGGVSVEDLCKPFDSIYVSFYKVQLT
jgi:threonine aldolase